MSAEEVRVIGGILLIALGVVTSAGLVVVAVILFGEKRGPK